MDLSLLNIGDGAMDKSKSRGEILSEDEDSHGSVEGAGFDTRRSLSSDDSDIDDCYNDEGLDLPVEDGDLAARLSFDHDDKYLQEIKESIAQKQNGDTKSVGSAGSGSNIESPQIKTSDQYVSIPYGLIPRASYEHGKRSTDIMGVTYNARMRQFIIIDSKGVTAWKRDAVDHRVSRALAYPKYEYGLITNMLYAKKYNCYFVLGKDFSLKVYNRDFYETCSVSADLRSVLFMLFNPVRDELITGGVGGTKVWTFHQQSGKTYTELKPLANYGLSLKYELPNVGGSWVKRVELDYHLEHLYCCSDTDLHVYDLVGKLLFKFERAHMMSITGCRYSRNASVLVTSSIDCEVKVWSLMGGLVHTFRGHSRAVTNLTLHPFTSSIVITCSLDGTVRMWSLDTMDTLYSLVVSTDGVMWMGLTDDNLLFLSTQRAITLWNLNYSLQFWAMARSKVNKMSLAGCKGKTTRLMALLDDNSVRLMARSNNKNLCTVLPPPSISPLQRVLSVCYSREFNVIFMLTNPHEIWVYTTRTDPSCRIAVWDVVGMQAMISNSASGRGNQENFDSTSISVNKPAPTHRATESGSGNEALANCCCVSILNSTAILWTEEGPCCPIRDSYLLMGLEDGRILFMDPVVKGHKYLEFKTGKDPVLDMTHDMEHGCLTTVHKLKDMMQILVWSLPDLELQHEVYAAMDLRAYARVGYTLVTGHESGCIIFNPLEFTNDPGLNKGRSFPLYAEVIDLHHKPEHLAPVIGVDVCPYQKIFCSCSNDGAIKIWNEDGALMTEIMLDPSLTSVCFLNNLGDLLVGFQKQIFYIDHTKVCPQLSVPESDVDGFEKESFICEDPAVLYEGVTPNPDPITLDSYLVPFDIEFSKDFLEGRVKLEPDPVKEEESDEESEASMAQTDTYLSPVSTPRSDLSQIDLTLGSEVSKYDLLKQMKRTLSHLQEKERLEAEEMVHQAALDSVHRSAQARKRRKMIKQGLLNVEDFEDGAITSVEDANVDGDGEGKPTKTQKGTVPFIPLKFEFPVFGESPGPSPESSSPPTPTALSDSEDDSELDITIEEKPIEVMKVQIAAREPDEISKFLETSKSTDFSTSTKSSKLEVSSTPRKKFGLSGISVDAASLMKEKKKAPKPPAMDSARLAAPPVAKIVETTSEKIESSRKDRSTKKRMSLTGRKLPKSKKIESMEDKLRPSSPPSSQMQALELKEQTLAVPEKNPQNQFKVADSSGEAPKEKLFDEKMKIKEEDLTKAADTKQQEEIVVKMDVPSLPTIPPDLTTHSEKPRIEMDRGQQLGSAASSGFKSASGMDNKSSIDFSSVSRAGTAAALSRETTVISSISVEEGTGNAGIGAVEGGLKRAETAATGDSGIVHNIDGLSVVSGASEEGQAAFRIGLISKEVSDADDQGRGLSAEHKEIVSGDEKKVSELKRDSTVRACHLTNTTEDPHLKKNAEAPKLSKKSSPKQNNSKNATNSYSSKQKVLFAKDKRKLSGGKKTELSTLGSLEEVEDTLEQSPASHLDQTETSDKQATLSTLLATQRKVDKSEGLPISGVEKNNKNTNIISVASKNSNAKSDAVKNFLESLPAPTPEDADHIDKSNSDDHFQTDNVEKSSLDSSYVRATTPSLSVIETESISSSIGPSLRGFTSSSPIPMVHDGLPYQSTPLPTVEEVSIKSWPSSIVSEISQPPAVATNLNDLKSTMVSSDSRTYLNETPSEVKETSVKGNEEASELTDARQDSSQMINESLKSASLHILDHSCQLKSSPDISRKSNGESVAGSEDNTVNTTKKESLVDLNQRIDNEHRDGKSSQSFVSESQERSSSKASSHTLELRDTSAETNLSPVSHIVISRKAEQIRGEQQDDQIDAEADKNNPMTSLGSNSEQEEGLESWDSDFDNMSVSDGSFMMSSPFSESTENVADGSAEGDGDGSSSSGKRRIRHQSLKNPGGNMSASSSATEPVLQVRIRKKPWSYYRNKEQQRSPFPPRKDVDGGHRKFSQSDAMTIQRNAYLDAAKLRRKRARSAVEGDSLTAQFQQMRRSPRQKQQQQPQQQANGTPTPTSSSATYCKLCAAEEGDNHQHDSKDTGLKNEQRRVSNVENRKVSFGGDGGIAEHKRSPRISDVGLLREASPRGKTTEATPVAPVAVAFPETRTGTDTTPKTPVGKWQREQQMTPTAAFESPRPHSQAVPSMAFSDMSSVRRAPSPTELNQSLAMTDFSHPQSHEDSEIRRPESVESGWMGSDLISVSRIGYHSAGVGGGTAGDGGDAADGATRLRNGQEASDLVDFHGLAGDEVAGHIPEEDKGRDSDTSSNKMTRPRTSLAAERTLGKPELDDAVKFFRQRPHTANVRFQTEDLQEAFDNTLERYKVMARPTMASDNLHRNDDMAFTENWHERQIERHMLIRMQKELRAQSAKQRRQIIEQRKQDRFRQHQEQDHGPQKSRFHPHHYAHTSLNPPQRCVTVHGSRPSQTTPTPTPVSSRPHTSTGLRDHQRLHPKHINNVSIHPASYQQAMLQLEKQQNQQQHQQQLSQQEQESVQREKAELNQEKAFRFRLREKEGVEQAEDPLTGEKTNIDLWAIDPRNPNALRPKSRKSIPSKCHRYVLVTKPKIKLTLPLPTPLEEELLASRFPDQGEKVYKKYEGLLYKPPKRPMYGIEYTPFQAFQT